MLSYLLASFARREEGQTLTEYALIIVLVALAVILALTALGGQIAAVFDQIVTELGGV